MADSDTLFGYDVHLHKDDVNKAFEQGMSQEEVSPQIKLLRSEVAPSKWKPPLVGKGDTIRYCVRVSAKGRPQAEHIRLVLKCTGPPPQLQAGSCGGGKRGARRLKLAKTFEDRSKRRTCSRERRSPSRHRLGGRAGSRDRSRDQCGLRARQWRQRAPHPPLSPLGLVPHSGLPMAPYRAMPPPGPAQDLLLRAMTLEQKGKIKEIRALVEQAQRSRSEPRR